MEVIEYGFVIRDRVSEDYAAATISPSPADCSVPLVPTLEISTTLTMAELSKQFSLRSSCVMRC